ncbi:hypothetical protein PENANT_c051G02936, partial [Penicillium antarcticum]
VAAISDRSPKTNLPSRKQEFLPGA